jgi:hypothetical protein
MEGCNDVSVINQEGTGGQQSLPLKRKDLSEAQSSCKARHSTYLLIFAFEFFMTKLNLETWFDALSVIHHILGLWLYSFVHTGLNCYFKFLGSIVAGLDTNMI